METRRITYLGLFTAAALVLHVVESALPPLLAFAPGAKMGLGNGVILVAGFILGVADAYFILTVRCLWARFSAEESGRLLTHCPREWFRLPLKYCL